MAQTQMTTHEEHFNVFLHDQLVGLILRRDDLTRFAFLDDYWTNAERAVLGLRFEDDRNARHRAHLRLPPWFSNLLPEGRLREWIASACKTPIQREMDLLAQVGHDLPGAVRVLRSDDAVTLDMSDDEPYSKRFDETNKRWSFSLAGVGLKFSMLARGDRLVIPGVGEGGDWILKLPDPMYPEVPRNELAMMTLARSVGIDVPEVRLVHRDQVGDLPEAVWSGVEEWAYAVRRFDRGSDRELIHIEDMAQVRGFYPDATSGSPGKYSGSYETVGALYYRGHDIRSLQEFARRVAFNIVIGNGDAHLKNWSLIYSDRRIPGISPAYDLVATFMYRPPDSGPEDMALRFGRSRRFDEVRVSTFERLDARLGAGAHLGEVALTVARDAVREWGTAAEILRGAPKMCREIERELSARAKRLLGSG